MPATTLHRRKNKLVQSSSVHLRRVNPASLSERSLCDDTHFVTIVPIAYLAHAPPAPSIHPTSKPASHSDGLPISFIHSLYPSTHYALIKKRILQIRLLWPLCLVSGTPNVISLFKTVPPAKSIVKPFLPPPCRSQSCCPRIRGQSYRLS